MPTVKSGVTSYTTPNDFDIVVTRIFDGPRQLVYDAWTKPEHIQQWMTGPEGWTMPICEMDARPGGTWRYVYRRSNGREMTLTGVVKEVIPPERFVTTEVWGPEWPEALNTTVFTESEGRTTVTLTITYPSREVRDAALGTGMKSGMDESFDRLDWLLGSL